LVDGPGGAGHVNHVVQIVASDNSSYCAVLSTGPVECWGQGAYGQLGNGDIYASNYPVVVEGLTGKSAGVTALSVAAGSSDSYCAVLASGGVDCWGEDVSGSLGAGSTSAGQDCMGALCARTPLPVREISGPNPLGGVRSLVSGPNGYCAILSEGGDLLCWGDGEAGELGNGASTASAVPVAVNIGA
jgi:alpha-tubulin suppressor-like RCC1 family protein